MEEDEEENTLIWQTQYELSGFSCRNKLLHFELPDRFKRGHLLKIVILDALWGIVLWGVLIYKIVNDSPSEYFKFYTNWTWTYNTLFYTVDLILILGSTRFFEYLFQMTFWWNFYCNVWLVGILVFPMLYSNAHVITDNFVSNGGTMHANIVLEGDRIVHVVPTWIAIVYLILRWDSWKEMLSITFLTDLYRLDADNLRKYMFIFYVIGMTFFGPVLFLIYYNAFDFHQIYNVSINDGFGFLIVIGVTLLTVPLMLFILMLSARYSCNNLDLSSWTIEYGIPSVDDVLEFNDQMAKS